MQHGLHNKGLHNSKTHPRSHRCPSPSGLGAREAEGTTCRGPGAWDAGAVGSLCSRLGALILSLVAAAPAPAPLQSSRDPLWPGAWLPTSRRVGQWRHRCVGEEMGIPHLRGFAPAAASSHPSPPGSPSPEALLGVGVLPRLISRLSRLGNGSLSSNASMALPLRGGPVIQASGPRIEAPPVHPSAPPAPGNHWSFHRRHSFAFPLLVFKSFPQRKPYFRAVDVSAEQTELCFQ